MDTVHERDVDPERTDRDGVAFERRQLAAETDAADLGCSLTAVEPDASAWPYHFHTANEEAIYVLAGEGELRGPEEVHVPIEPGTYASFPVGPDGVHEVTNTGDETLRFLTISTMVDPDVLVYPDSEKVGVMAGEPPGGDTEARVVSAFFRSEDAVDYWNGETDE